MTHLADTARMVGAARHIHTHCVRIAHGEIFRSLLSKGFRWI